MGQDHLRCYLIHSTKNWILTRSSGAQCPCPNTGPPQAPTSQHAEDHSSHAGQISTERDFWEDIKVINVGQSHPNLSSKPSSVGLQKKDSKNQLHNLSKTRYTKTWPKDQSCRGGLKLSMSPLLQPANPSCEVPMSKVLSIHQWYETGPQGQTPLQRTVPLWLFPPSPGHLQRWQFICSNKCRVLRYALAKELFPAVQGNKSLHILQT